MISAERLTKIFNRHKPNEVVALDDVSLTIAPGEVVVINGASGSGKTTLLSLLGCMARPTSGSVIIQDREISKLPERFLTEVRRASFGFIFQQFNLIRDITVLDNVLLPLYPLSISMADMRRRAEEIIERLDIKAKAGMKISALSGGEQQRAAIARSLVNMPEVIFADEPTAHLDSSLAAEFMTIIAELNQDGKTIVIATHDSFVTEHSAVQRVVRMRDGQMLSEV